MAHRRPNPRLVKLHRTYTVHEISALLGVHRNTVRRWFASGLERVGGKGLTLARGQPLRDFLTARREKSKRPCPPGFMYCLRCRDRKEPSGRVADLIQADARVGNLRGLCPDCGCLMHRRVSLAKLDQVRGRLEVSVPAARPHIGGASDPSVNGDN